MLLLSIVAEVSLGLFTYLHFNNLLFRFLFFVLTTIIVAMIIVKVASEDDIDEDQSFTDNQEQLAD